MVEPLSVDTDGMRSLSDVHTQVAAGLGSLTSSAPGSAAVAGSHGTVAHAVETALSAALDSRSGAMTTTQDNGSRIAELLHEAVAAYERGDHDGAEAMTAAAGQLGQQLGAAGPARQHD